jgi:hypothetical protein
MTDPFGYDVQDPWLDPLRSYPQFVRTLARAEDHHSQAVLAFRETGLEDLFGIRI